MRLLFRRHVYALTQNNLIRRTNIYIYIREQRNNLYLMMQFHTLVSNICVNLRFVCMKRFTCLSPESTFSPHCCYTACVRFCEIKKSEILIAPSHRLPNFDEIWSGTSQRIAYDALRCAKPNTIDDSLLLFISLSCLVGLVMALSR